MRSLAIAEEARRRGIPTCFLIGGDEAALSAVTRRGFESIRAFNDEAWLENLSIHDVLIFDGYTFEPELMHAAKKRVARVGAIDDLGYGQFPVDVLLNQNPVVTTTYDLREATTLLLGPHYALVRDEFLAHRRDRSRDDPRTLLVATGGSDVARLAPLAIRLWDRQDAFEGLVVVLGPAAPDVETASLPPSITLIRAPDDIAATFSKADAAISAAGSTTWELLYMGLPTALVTVADNQASIGPGVDHEGAGLFVGRPQDLKERFEQVAQWLAEPKARTDASRNALRLVDGEGPGRFLDALMPAITRESR